MDYSLSIVTPPTDEPVSLVEAKQHLRVVNDVEDDLIAGFVQAAREYVEGVTRLQLMPAVYQMSLNGFPRGPILFPISPVSAVGSIVYDDGTGAEIAYDDANYSFDPGRIPQRVDLGYGLAWPQTRGVANDVRVVFTAGFSSRDAVPASMKSAIKLLVADLYQNRESQSPVKLEDNRTVDRLLWINRVIVV